MTTSLIRAIVAWAERLGLERDESAPPDRYRWYLPNDRTAFVEVFLGERGELPDEMARAFWREVADLIGSS